MKSAKFNELLHRAILAQVDKIGLSARLVGVRINCYPDGPSGADIRNPDSFMANICLIKHQPLQTSIYLPCGSEKLPGIRIPGFNVDWINFLDDGRETHEVRDHNGMVAAQIASGPCRYTIFQNPSNKNWPLPA